MNTSTTVRPMVAVSGKGKAARQLAFTHIAVDSFMAETSRGALVATLRTALGDAPTPEQLDIAKREYVIGRIASRLPVTELPKGCKDTMDKLEFARNIVCNWIAPVAAGAKAKALPKGKTGRRTEVQHRLVRNAEESWSQVKADIGLGTAKADRDKAKAKRAPAMAGDKGKAAAPSHEQLVQPARAVTQDEACQHIVTQAAALLQFANKHAKLLPTDFGMAVQAFKTAINKAANDKALRDAKATSEK